MGGYRLTDPSTSRRAYEHMRDTGMLSQRRLEICDVLSTQRPLTAGQIGEWLRRNRNNIATRLSELEHMGAVEKIQEVICPVSGNQCWAWQLTGRQPRKYYRVKKARLCERCAALI